MVKNIGGMCTWDKEGNQLEVYHYWFTFLVAINKIWFIINRKRGSIIRLNMKKNVPIYIRLNKKYNGGN